ncbi:signal recognition particle-docking protein FtsY [Candidatus Latescibacterota bacterium]
MAVNIFTKITESLAKTRNSLIGPLSSLLPSGGQITEDMLEEVETVLYEADLGVHAVDLLVAELRRRAGDIRQEKADPFEVMRDKVVDIIDRFGEDGFSLESERPYVILVLGVNGTGKTTTIGKLALRFNNGGKTVLLAACDTFRAAAAEQLEVWAQRSGSEFIMAHPGADPASVAYDAVRRAETRSTDVVIIDTAGRLHTSQNLLAELKKIRRVIHKANEVYPQETLLVLDANNGQNALVQAQTFNCELGVTGIVLTKLDGTARGGIVVSIIDRLGIPVKFIGVGEKIEDLQDFNPHVYAEALFARKPGGPFPHPI